ncbi:MAG: MtrAB system histidine kinase MtrB [Corynebacterium sp.]|uniref:MtrAB system histidine kinase MtrB n=1 Tax=Corynebacterium sp. TaxID=1720 RepID=UPI0026DAD53C|nr:MtrAB system histidine kinase MtrB [Corynebacterium sp.]MDO5030204.1 MtrAB system histidine kinase MtrB [Corynebacterium sp.]
MTWAITLWRTSIQARILTSVVVLSAMVIAVLGFALATIVAQRLIDAKVTAADEEIDRARAVVEQAIENSTANELQALLNIGRDALVNRTSNAGSAPLTSYEPLLLAPVPRGTVLATSPSGTEVPQRLHDIVRQGQIAYQVRQVPDENGGTYSALIIGTPTSTSVDGLELYLVTPMAAEESTIKLVRGLLAGTTVVILALLGGITWFFSNQVTQPVRSAAQIAQRFADGHLRERMAVQGEDDMARLAMSFNKMAESLSTQIRQLEEYGSLQRQFTSDVSHELRTPLTTVRMAADMIADGAEDLDPATRRAAELMNEELDRFEMLLNDLLEISRHDAGVADLSAEKVDVRRCVDAAYQQVAVVAKETGTPIRLHLPEEPVIATVDSRRIERVLRNLMANAVDHSEGNPVDVTVHASDSAVSFTVVDHGVGLKPEQADLVFNRFWRADPSRVRRTGGTGLGLAIAREDAQLHGGDLDAFGVPTVGSCFRLTVPLEPNTNFGEHPLGLEVPPLPTQAPHQELVQPLALEQGASDDTHEQLNDREERDS